MDDVCFQVSDSLGDYLVFWCPGCALFHGVRTKAAGSYADHLKTVKHDGLFDKPSLSDWWSITHKDRNTGRMVHCTVTLKNGKIVYGTDATHHLKGSEVEMRSIPDEEVDKVKWVVECKGVVNFSIDTTGVLAPVIGEIRSRNER